MAVACDKPLQEKRIFKYLIYSLDILPVLADFESEDLSGI